MNSALDIPSVRQMVSPEEWQVRVELAAAYRLVALFGWDDLVFTHISARVPGREHEFLINPYGLFFEEITASSLVKVDHEGQPVMPTPFDVNPAGFVIHSAVHEARPNVNCVLHTYGAWHRGRRARGRLAAVVAAIRFRADESRLSRL
jgi:ribulose-5-phosphate 4-epimerase/fuculose-1-phosphate aldolase